MTSALAPADGVSRFMADLEEEGHAPTGHGDVVRYFVIPVGAGTPAKRARPASTSASSRAGRPCRPTGSTYPMRSRSRHQQRRAGLRARLAAPFTRGQAVGHGPQADPHLGVARPRDARPSCPRCTGTPRPWLRTPTSRWSGTCARRPAAA